MIKMTAIFVALVAALPMASSQAAGVSGANSHSAKALLGALSPQQRGAAIAQFVRQWGPYVENAYGLDVHTWSQRMVQQFAVGDATNIQRALARTTFEGAMAELDGVGHRLSDDQAITALASSPSVTPTMLGSASSDLVFTPLTPCRIADTRLSAGGSGPIAASSSKAFEVWGTSSYAFQGGSATDCGLLSESPQAVVLNVTAVTPSAAGYATVYPADAASRPVISSINYVAGAVVNNSVVTPLGRSGTGNDVQIYSVAQANYVVDVVGYFDPPHATPLDTTTTSNTVSVATGTDGFVTYSGCPSTYVRTGGYCYGADSHPNAYLLETGANGCVFRNATGSPLSITAVSACSRVPGR